MAETLSPTALDRRSYLCRTHATAGAVFAEANGFAVPQTYGASVEEETARAHEMGIADLSHVSRTGFKGWNAATWLAAQGCTFEDASNFAYVQSCGARLLRLAPNELLVLGDTKGESGLVDKLDAAWSMETSDGTFAVPRADTNCWLKVTGEHAPSMFAKICAIDLRPGQFDEGAIAQTSVARLNCIVARNDIGLTIGYDILTDSASAEYFWKALLDAMEEFSGAPVGVAAVKQLAGV
ncbi:MAG: sarcosine oxidase [Alphaproteobacteria bacterium]|jgi:sarcosine oxidase, subunit gamma|nr:sarcosine oxidase [Alphaproteobacteria bacterium]